MTNGTTTRQTGHCYKWWDKTCAWR